MVPRVIVFEAAADGEPSLARMLTAGGCDVTAAATPGALADAVASGRHQAVLFALVPGRSDDLVSLRLLRRVAPEFPLIIVANDTSLDVRRLIQTMRPIYFAARPVDPEELCEAVRAACEPPRRELPAPVRPERPSERPARHGHQTA